MLKTGSNCWRIERAQRASVIVDAADYFYLAREAMLKARSQIFLIGWDFDTRIALGFKERDAAPTELGAFLSWLTKNRPELQIYILKWDVGALKLLGRGTTVLRLAHWAAGKNIHFRLDGAHPSGGSHHHKILVIDDKLAFCGGIDMTADRWDTRDHLDNDEYRRRPTTRRRYGPWHDATMPVDGAAAKALGELARERWQAAGGKPVSPPGRSRTQPWPRRLDPMFREVDIAISRTRGAYNGNDGIREIEALFVAHIACAKRFVYAENQYFASRRIAQAVADRLRKPNPPEFVIINPRTGQGWLDDEVMSPARAKLVEYLRGIDTDGRFRIYTPITEQSRDIYVHSKILIVDGELIRVGSANFNNRSMGLDSECDLTIDCALSANRAAAAPIERMLHSLLGEHLQVAPEVVVDKMNRSTLIETIEALRGRGRTLKPLKVQRPNMVEQKLAETEALDPEGAGEEFEPMARPKLLARLRGYKRES